jgi:hypothetical protein
MLALCFVAAVAPGGALLIAVLFGVLARTVQRSTVALQRRRQELGPSRSDVAVTVATLPWRVLLALLSSLLAAILPTLVAISTVFIVGAVRAQGATSHPAGPLALGIGMAAGIATSWWGPGGWSLRNGSRAVVRSLTGTSAARVVLLALCAMVLVAALMVAAKPGHAPSWEPFPRPHLPSQNWTPIG